jgi:chromosome segregation and condensation protein ScpB
MAEDDSQLGQKVIAKATKEGGSVQQDLSQPEADPLRVIEAALFLGNRPFDVAELAMLSKTSVRKCKALLLQLQKEYESEGRAIEVSVDVQRAVMQVRQQYLQPVAHLSKNIELSKKALRIIALISKKGKLKQSELHKYFRGDIYAYIAELKDQGYVSSEKAGSTRLLRPTSKFSQTFQVAQETTKEQTRPVQQSLATQEGEPELQENKPA